MSPRYILRLIEAFFKRFRAIIGIGGRFTPDNMPEEISTKLSNGLTKIDGNGNVSPSLAKSWESPDSGKTWIFTVDENATWQDAKKVVAKDIDSEFSDATTEIINDSTIKFNLD